MLNNTSLSSCDNKVIKISIGLDINLGFFVKVFFYKKPGVVIPLVVVAGKVFRWSWKKDQLVLLEVMFWSPKYLLLSWGLHMLLDCFYVCWLILVIDNDNGPGSRRYLSWWVIFYSGKLAIKIIIVRLLIIVVRLL